MLQMLFPFLIVLSAAQPDVGCPEEFNQIWADYVGICTDGGGEEINSDEDCAAWCIYLPDNSYTAQGYDHCDSNPKLFCSTYPTIPPSSNPTTLPTASWISPTDGQTETPWHGKPGVEYFMSSGPCEVAGRCVSSSGYSTGQNYANDTLCYITVLQTGPATLSTPFEIELGYDTLTVEGVPLTTPAEMVSVLNLGDQIIWQSDFSRTYQGWQICIGDGSASPTTAPTAQPGPSCPQGYEASSLRNICTRDPLLPKFQLLYECDSWCAVSVFDNPYYLDDLTMCGAWTEIYEKKLTQCEAEDVCVPQHRLLGENNTMCGETCVPMVNCTSSLALNYTNFGTCEASGYSKYITDFTSYHEGCGESFHHSLWEQNATSTVIVEQKDCWIYITNPITSGISTMSVLLLGLTLLLAF